MVLEDYIYNYIYIFDILVTWRLKYNKINDNMVYIKGIYNNLDDCCHSYPEKHYRLFLKLYGNCTKLRY